MSKLKNKIKNFIDGIISNINDNVIDSIINENEDYLDAELMLLDKYKNGVEGIIEYAKNEISSLDKTADALNHTCNIINTNRKEKVEDYKSKILEPLEKLATNYDVKETMLKKLEKSKKNKEKIQKKLEKEESKQEEKRKPQKIERYKILLGDAERLYNKNGIQATLSIKTFEKEKLETFKTILNELVQIEADYHQMNLKAINKAKDIVEIYESESDESELTKSSQTTAINVEET